MVRHPDRGVAVSISVHSSVLCRRLRHWHHVDAEHDAADDGWVVSEEYIVTDDAYLRLGNVCDSHSIGHCGDSRVHVLHGLSGVQG